MAGIVTCFPKTTTWTKVDHFAMGLKDISVLFKLEPSIFALGAFNNRLRGQEEGEGGQPKVHACPLECPRGQKPSYFRKCFILLCTVMGGQKGIKLNCIELNI